MTDYRPVSLDRASVSLDRASLKKAKTETLKELLREMNKVLSRGSIPNVFQVVLDRSFVVDELQSRSK